MKRLARVGDLSNVYKIYMDELVIPYLGYDSMSVANFQPIFNELVESENFYVYEIAGEIAAFFKTFRLPGRCSHVAYIGTLAVSPHFQGRGLAKKIIKELMAELIESGVKRIELLVESDNPRAIQFYKGLGFEIEGTLKKFYKRSDQDFFVDEHVMAFIP